MFVTVIVTIIISVEKQKVQPSFCTLTASPITQASVAPATMDAIIVEMVSLLQHSIIFQYDYKEYYVIKTE